MSDTIIEGSDSGRPSRSTLISSSVVHGIGPSARSSRDPRPRGLSPSDRRHHFDAPVSSPWHDLGEPSHVSSSRPRRLRTHSVLYQPLRANNRDGRRGRARPGGLHKKRRPTGPAQSDDSRRGVVAHRHARAAGRCRNPRAATRPDESWRRGRGAPTAQLSGGAIGRGERRAGRDLEQDQLVAAQPGLAEDRGHAAGQLAGVAIEEARRGSADKRCPSAGRSSQ